MEDAYSNKVDMWSIGCLVFVILTAHLPFSGSTQQALFKNIMSGNFHESLLKENDVSIEGRDFISRLLETDVSLRLNAKQALSHPWIREMTPTDSQVSLSQSQSYQERMSQVHSQRQQQIIKQIKHEFLNDNNKSADFKIPQLPKPSQKPHDPTENSSPAASSILDRTNPVIPTSSSIIEPLSKISMHSPKTPTTEETNAAPPGTFLTLNLLTEHLELHDIR
ncbi:unnamed protein product [Ambrosiozyma monospora]|uniref:Unnamed protein product n=1 Tax=Ambrosiozyma monospora TaxID=43982 RepID=A0ACB5UBT7_AMBMO|nr:unnamed protein product [Ambrosiozyma monospora]